jgi:hypothetical protein
MQGRCVAAPPPRRHHRCRPVLAPPSCRLLVPSPLLCRSRARAKADAARAALRAFREEFARRQGTWLLAPARAALLGALRLGREVGLGGAAGQGHGWRLPLCGGPGGSGATPNT